jgi:hypothetical protein
MVRMEDVVIYVSFVNREHLARHALIAFVSAPAMLQEALANLFDRHLVRIGPIGARLHLAFDMNAEGISGLLV